MTRSMIHAWSEGSAAMPSSARRRFRTRLLVFFVLVMIVPEGRQLIASPTTGQDFRAFFAAASVVAHHGNPYDWTVLGRMEDQLYNKPAGRRPGDTTYYDFLPFPEGPWLAFALAPLTGLPWQLAYAIFAAMLSVILLIAGTAGFRETGWPWGAARKAGVIALLSAVGFINVFMGQASLLVLAAFVAGWILARRGHPWWAGGVLALVWIKPNIGVPLPLVVMLLQPSAARRILGSFCAATAALFGLAGALLGLSFLEWPVQPLRMWQSVQGVQPDIASFESFFYPGLQGEFKMAALGLTLVVALAYGVWAIRRAPDDTSRGLTLMLVWLFALPFVQSYDLILLLPVIAVLLGPDLQGLGDPLVEITVWCFLTFPFLYFAGFRLGYFNGFSAVPMTLAMLTWHRQLVRRRRRRPQALAA